MPLSRDEAADALRDLSRTERRSATAHGNHASSPHLIMWGLIWAAEYTGFYLYPQHPIIFPALSFLGVIGSWVLGARNKQHSSSFSWRYAATFVVVFAFIAALFAIMPPTRNAQLAAFFPLLVALAYTLMGIWMRLVRIGIVGIAIGVLTLVGYFYLEPYLLLWLAFVGGGALVLGGFWLRSV